MLCFERLVRARLGVAISEVSGPPIFHIQVRRPASKLASLFSTTFHKCLVPSREAIDTTFKNRQGE